MRKSHYIILYLCGVALMALPYLLALTSPQYRGLPLFFGDQSAHYVVRLQEGLLDGDTSNGIFSGPGAPAGLQPAGLEWTSGRLLGWTGWNATTISILLVIFFTPIMLPLMVLLGKKLNAPAYVGILFGTFFFVILTAPLHRFVSQSLCLPITLASFVMLISWWQKRTLPRAIAAGILLGVLPYTYFWSWTWMWATFGSLCILALLFRKDGKLPLRDMIVIGTVALLLALPYFAHLLSTLKNPLAAEVSARSSIFFVRDFESPARSFVLFAFSIAAFIAWKRKIFPVSTLPLLASLLGITLAFNQQFIHGEVLSFSSHYYPYVCLVALAFLILIAGQRSLSPLRILLALFSIVFLLGAAIDYAFWNEIFTQGKQDFQHLGSLYTTLRDGPKETVLSDRVTSLYIASNTKDDVVFTEHLRHVLIPTSEYAERYCLSEYLFNPQEKLQLWIPSILSELTRLDAAHQKKLFDERLATTKDACTWVTEHPKESLQKYGVTMLLWNQTLHPEWKVDPALFEKVQDGSGASLWRPRQ